MNAARISSRAAARITGVSTRQLHHWDALGVVSPSLTPATGSGSRRSYTADDLLGLLVARELRRMHVGLRTIREVVSAVGSARVAVTCDLRTRLVWADARAAYLGCDGQAAAQAVLAEPGAIAIHLGRLAADARCQIPETAFVSVHSISVGQRTYRVVVSRDERGMVARCAAVPRCTARAATERDALAAIVERLRTTQRPPTHQPATDQPTSATRPSRGAAAWGESW